MRRCCALWGLLVCVAAVYVPLIALKFLLVLPVAAICACAHGTWLALRSWARPMCGGALRADRRRLGACWVAHPCACTIWVLTSDSVQMPSIFVRTLNGSVAVPQEGSVSELKQEIEARAGVAADCVRLAYNGHILQDDELLEDLESKITLEL